MKEVTNERISKNMRALRLKRGLTQEEVADIMEVNRLTVVNWENRPGKVTIKTFIELADLYKCDVADFFME